MCALQQHEALMRQTVSQQESAQVEHRITELLLRYIGLYISEQFKGLSASVLSQQVIDSALERGLAWRLNLHLEAGREGGRLGVGSTLQELGWNSH